MPQVVAWVAYWVGTALLTIGVSETVALAIGYVVGTILVNGTIAAATAALLSPDVPSFRAKAQGRTAVVRSSIEPHRVVYGQCVVSGPLVFAETTGPRNCALHLVIVLASHELEEISTVYINDLPSTDDRFADEDFTGSLEFDATANKFRGDLIHSGWRGRIVEISGSSYNDGLWEIDATDAVTAKARRLDGNPMIDESGTITISIVSLRITKHLGTTTQLADADLTRYCSNWDSSHRLQGRAYLYVMLGFNPDSWVTGLPNVKALVKGKKVYDPRDTTTAWSDNWALCVYDYMTSTYGIDADASEIDTTSFNAAANVSDESVVTPDGTQSRYTCNGTFDTSERPADIMTQLLTAGAGSIVYAQGTYRLISGSYSAPVAALDEDDLRGPLRVRPRPPRKELFNGVKGVFADPTKNYQATDWPVVKNATYATQDGAEIIRDIELSYTTDIYAAQRIGKLLLEKARQGIVVEFPAKVTALALNVGDNITLTIDQMGWSSKEFVVTSWTYSPDGGVDLVLQEEAETAYDWDSGEATVVDSAPDTNLPSAWYSGAPTALTLASGESQLFVAGDGTVVTRIYATWDAPEDSIVTAYELCFKPSLSNSWQVLKLPADATAYYISGVQDGVQYDVRVRARNSIGAWGQYETVLRHTVVGRSDPPASVSSFLIDATTAGVARFSWTMNTVPVDLAGYHIRYKSGTGQVWGDMSALHTGILTSSPYEARTLSADTYTFGIKAVDTSGNESTTPLYIEADITESTENGILARYNCYALGWPGTKTDCYVASDTGYLAATDTKTWADFAIDGDTWADWLAWSRVPSDPIQYQHSTINLGGLLPVTLAVTVVCTGTPTIEERHSNDNITYSSWAAISGLITTQYIQVRVSVTDADPAIQSMNIAISADTQTEDLQDIDTSTLTGSYDLGVGNVRLPMTVVFKKYTSISVTLQNVGAGWSWELIDKTSANALTYGPEIKIYDGTDTLADCTIDATVRGIV